MHPPFPVPPAQGQQFDLVTAGTGVLFGPGGVGAGVERFEQTDFHRSASLKETSLVGAGWFDKASGGLMLGRKGPTSF